MIVYFQCGKIFLPDPGFATVVHGGFRGTPARGGHHWGAGGPRHRRWAEGGEGGQTNKQTIFISATSYIKIQKYTQQRKTVL